MSRRRSAPRWREFPSSRSSALISKWIVERSLLDQSPNFLQPGSGAQPSSDTPTADWVRIRHEFAVQALFSSVQYSFSKDSQNMVETVVFHVRDPKDLMEVSLEDRASSVTSPEDMLTATTPVSHIKLERFGKSSVVLAQCPDSENGPPPDQSAYEPLFSSATKVLDDYRSLLHARSLVPEEMARINGTGATKTDALFKASASTQAPEMSPHPCAVRRHQITLENGNRSGSLPGILSFAHRKS